MFSKIIRRTHMYLALFLGPWMLMYALSTMAMNHRDPSRAQPQFEKEREQAYAASFPADAKPRQIGEQILRDLHLEGAFGVQGPAPDGRLTINRQDLVEPRRIVYTPADAKLTIEKLAFRTPAFLERFHRRRGYQQHYMMDNTWAFTVDLVIVAMVFWVLSGLWMWWEMRVTRLWGAAFALLGVALFAFFVAKI
jgi:hypothetical protein